MERFPGRAVWWRKRLTLVECAANAVGAAIDRPFSRNEPNPPGRHAPAGVNRLLAAVSRRSLTHRPHSVPTFCALDEGLTQAREQ